jgi:hypothetical protein
MIMFFPQINMSRNAKRSILGVWCHQIWAFTFWDYDIGTHVFSIRSDIIWLNTNLCGIDMMGKWIPWIKGMAQIRENCSIYASTAAVADLLPPSIKVWSHLEVAYWALNLLPVIGLTQLGNMLDHELGPVKWMNVHRETFEISELK